MPDPLPTTGEMQKLLAGWEYLASIVEKKGGRTWAETCTMGAGRHMEIAKVLPYIRTLEAENAQQKKQLRQAAGAIKLGIRVAEELEGQWAYSDNPAPGDIRLKRGKMQAVLSRLPR